MIWPVCIEKCSTTWKIARQRRHVGLLNGEALQQTVGIKRRQCRVNFIQSLPQTLEKFVARNNLTLRKLRIAVALVRRASQTNDNPLPHVATQMQQQISDTV